MKVNLTSETQQCTKCSEFKSIIYFPKDKYKTSGYRPVCKKCANEINKLYRQTNKEKLQIKQKERWINNYEEMRDIGKRYRKKHKDKIKNKAHIKYISNLPLVLFRASKNRARIKKLEHSISIEDVIIPQICPVLGIPIFHSEGGRPTGNSPSIDRINNNLGYIKGNILVISWRANNLKRDATIEELQKIVNFYKKFEGTNAS